MSDLFTSLVQRSRGTAAALDPRLPSRFEPAEVTWGEIEESVTVAQPRRRIEPVAEPIRVPEARVEDQSERVATPPLVRPWEPVEKIVAPVPAFDETNPIREAPPAEQRLREVTTIIREVVNQTAAPSLAPAEAAPERANPVAEHAPVAPLVIPAERVLLSPLRHDAPVERERPVRGPAVEVHIGRIEVKAPPPQPSRTAPAPRSTRPRVALSLHDYLSQRRRS